MPYVDRPAPETGPEGKVSFQYTIGTALLDGAVTPRSFTDERRFRADMVALLPKIELSQSDAIPGDLEHMHVEIKIDWADGQRTAATCSGPRGFWGLPRLTPDEHFVKIRDCLAVRRRPPPSSAPSISPPDWKRLALTRFENSSGLLAMLRWRPDR